MLVNKNFALYRYCFRIRLLPSIKSHVKVEKSRICRKNHVKTFSQKVDTNKKVISTNKAPEALGPYSQAIKINDMLYLSGQLGIKPGTKELISDDIAEQTKQVMDNIGAILKESGLSYDKLVKTTILLSSMDNFAVVNSVYGKYFEKDPPSRSCFAVKTLPLNALIEIEAIATF